MIDIGSGIDIGPGINIGSVGPGVPTPPIIGVATATGPTTATVSFTTPIYDGGFTITSYTATSSPGGITGTVNQSGSGTINMTGLSQNTSYTFTVTATNSFGTSNPSSPSNIITTFAVPVNTVAPVVSGTAAFGQTLSSTKGTWTGTATIIYTYQWQRNNTNIPSATTGTYTLVQADVGNPIRCVVTGTNSYGNSSANSNSTSNVVPIVPGAPTVGTATAISYNTATVEYTAPSSNGGATITRYTATSNPDGITGILNQAGSGTITVEPLNGSTTYTFTVTATNSAGTSSPSAASNSITTPVAPKLYKAIFGYGLVSGGAQTSFTNLVSVNGVVSNDVTSAGTARSGLAAAIYGTDKAIFGFGNSDFGFVSITNLVSNTGVVGNDVAGVGTARFFPAASGYGTDKAIFGYGFVGTAQSITNLVSDTGVVATDTAGVGTARTGPAAAAYGVDKAIFGFGQAGSGASLSVTNQVSNTGVVSNDVSTVGTPRYNLAASGYGFDKAIFAYGVPSAGPALTISNLISNTGVMANDVTNTLGRRELAAAGYGADKAIFGYGNFDFGVLNNITLVSNTGVLGSTTTGVGTARYGLAASSYG